MPSNFRSEWRNQRNALIAGCGLSICTNRLFAVFSRSQQSDQYHIAIQGMIIVSLLASALQYNAHNRLAAQSLYFVSIGIMLGYKVTHVLRSIDSISEEVRFPPLAT